MNFKYECYDALQYVKQIPNDSIKLILTSPPYNIGKDYEKKLDINSYLSNMIPLIKELQRIMEVDGSICWQVGNYVENGEVFPLDIYYDPFAGVGSTLIASLKNNRVAYGTELNPDYVKIGIERIKLLSEGLLKTRPIYQKIYVPKSTDKIAMRPKEWNDSNENDSILQLLKWS